VGSWLSGHQQVGFQFPWASQRQTRLRMMPTTLIPYCRGEPIRWVSYRYFFPSEIVSESSTAVLLCSCCCCGTQWSAVMNRPRFTVLTRFDANSSSQQLPS
ncbi:unnamed protein product, partial [Pylaiella littoralis]